MHYVYNTIYIKSKRPMFSTLFTRIHLKVERKLFVLLFLLIPILLNDILKEKIDFQFYMEENFVG